MLHFLTMCNLSTVYFIPQPRGILHFISICPLPEAGYEFHFHIPPKIHLTETHIPLLSHHPQNCTKFSHNSLNSFDNHFDKLSKYPSTNINNKLSDNYKNHQNPLKSQKSPLIPPTLLSSQISKHPLNKAFK